MSQMFSSCELGLAERQIETSVSFIQFLCNFLIRTSTTSPARFIYLFGNGQYMYQRTRQSLVSMQLQDVHFAEH
jgi:hypothetical protein